MVVCPGVKSDRYRHQRHFAASRKILENRSCQIYHFLIDVLIGRHSDVDADSLARVLCSRLIREFDGFVASYYELRRIDSELLCQRLAALSAPQRKQAHFGQYAPSTSLHINISQRPQTLSKHSDRNLALNRFFHCVERRHAPISSGIGESTGSAYHKQVSVFHRLQKSVELRSHVPAISNTQTHVHQSAKNRRAMQSQSAANAAESSRYGGGQGSFETSQHGVASNPQVSSRSGQWFGIRTKSCQIRRRLSEDFYARQWP